MDLDAGAVVPTQQSGDVLLELTPVHGVDRGHDSGDGALFLRALKTPQLVVVPDEPALDLPDGFAEADELPLLLAGGLDEGVQYGDDGGAEEAREALLAESRDACVE
ncbi:hypothetical protein ACIOMQ_07450 [Streptomyces sp. NPDC087845]|uniref:hypothetical protein n=1 Tax=Streptomyces sp. NPDC087845 TaxID=3365806 RepID=UPI0038110813